MTTQTKISTTKDLPRIAKNTIPVDSVLLGYGGGVDFQTPPSMEIFRGWKWNNSTKRWDLHAALSGNSPDVLYAAPRGSLIVGLLRSSRRVKPSEPSDIHRQLLPPDGAVVLGYGQTFKVPMEGFSGWTWDINSVCPCWKWYDGNTPLKGEWRNRIYAAPVHERVVSMNGLNHKVVYHNHEVGIPTHTTRMTKKDIRAHTNTKVESATSENSMMALLDLSEATKDLENHLRKNQLVLRVTSRRKV